LNLYRYRPDKVKPEESPKKQRYDSTFEQRIVYRNQDWRVNSNPE
jgi:hypothetical protein